MAKGITCCKICKHQIRRARNIYGAMFWKDVGPLCYPPPTPHDHIPA